MNPTEIQYKLLTGYQLSPKDWQLIGLTADLTVDFSELKLTEDTLRFEGDDRTELLGILDNVGLEAAIPMLVIVPSGSPTVADIQIEYVLTVKDGFTEADTYLEFSVEKRYGIGRFIDRANSTTWDDINDKTPITGAVKFPYRVIDPNPVPQLSILYAQGAMSSIALYDSVTFLGFAISSALGGITGLAESTSQIALAAIRTALVAVTLTITGNQIFRTYYPEQKYLWENKVLSLMQQGCAYLGYTLSSTLLQSYANLGIVAVPQQDNNETVLNDLFDGTNYFNGKFPSSLDSVPNFGAFFSEVKKMFAAKIMIVGNVLHFESDAFYQNNPQPQIKKTFNDQDAIINRKTYNTSESWFNKYIGYSRDSSDRYTLDQIKGLRAEYRTKYLGTADADLVDITGATRIDLAFSLAKRKKKLTYLDEQAIQFGFAVDGIINFFGGNSDLVGLVKSSIGQMLISSQHFVKTKIVWAVGGKQTPNYLDVIGAKAIYQNNHTHLQVKENFQEIQEMQVPFSIDNFRAIINSYYIIDENNTSLKVINYSYIPYESQILLNFGIYRPEKSNTETIEIHG